VILVDAGPLVAFVDRRDKHHGACVKVFRELRESLGTVWPALTEAMYLLADLPRGQEAIWDIVERGAVRILSLDSGDVPRIRELMKKYADRQMDMADAALVRVAERERLRRVFTIDRTDFSVYRLSGGRRLALLP
jgi:Predicted nucleic acid-binding protein, contains PIN domain